MPEEVICALELEDLNKGANCGNNMSGVKNVYIALKDNVSQFPKLPSNRTSYEDFAVLEGNGATISFVYDTPTAQVYTSEMDSLIEQSTNLDDPVTP